MTDYSNLPFHPMMEKIVDILRKKTQNQDPVFFRIVVSYYFAKVASMMRTRVRLADDQVVPVNMYAINLAPSGSGKGHSINIIEEEIISGFRQRFLDHTFPALAEKRITKLAHQRAQRDQTDPDLEMQRAMAEFEEHGPLLFAFDSGTGAAIKQMRAKLLMAAAGSMNFEMDEIGSNLTGNTEILNHYLELFDTGRIKQKLVKNTRDNMRSEDLFGATPTNMLLFGTPSKLLNGYKLEDEFIEMLETGYARRCFFGFSRFRKGAETQTPEELYKLYHDKTASRYLMTLRDRFTQLANPATFNQELQMKKDVMLAWYEYRIYCNKVAAKLSEYAEVRKAEIVHRYFKVAKLAGTYAFVDKSPYITLDHLHYAIAMAEQSGVALKGILNREKAYVKLCNYICTIDKELTQADLAEDLPFYKGSEMAKREMLNLATAHGYKNGMYIKSEIIDGIQFLSGKKVQETDLDRVKLSFSTQITEGYRNQEVPFDKLHKLIEQPSYHWCNHFLREGYRDEDHVFGEANLIVLDVENSIDIPTAKLLLKDYAWLLHETKSHTDKSHRFRIIMPMSHHFELNKTDYRDFMRNIYEWLPFEVDTVTHDRCRKWLTHNGNYWYNKGQLLDTLQFIPKTKKADERKQLLASQTNLTALERWSLNQAKHGNRNHTLARYAFTLVELGQPFDAIRAQVLDMNSKLDEPLDDSEIHSTVLTSVNRRIAQRGTTDDANNEQTASSDSG